MIKSISVQSESKIHRYQDSSFDSSLEDYISDEDHDNSKLEGFKRILLNGQKKILEETENSEDQSELSENKKKGFIQ